MSQRIRLTKQLQQEKISRGQYHTLLSKLGWMTDDFINDLGEDIRVRIYEKGISTGIHFDTQLKSTENIDEHRIVSGEISYRFEVKDLEHWEGQGVPVVMVIWDICEEKGWWLLVRDAIKFLDKNTPDWRSQKTIKIHIPYENTFDGDNKKRLRQLLAHYLYPIISENRPVTIQAQFIFPQTPEGQAKLEELERHFDFGDEFVISGENIEKFDFPEWWQRLFGEPNLENLVVKWGPNKGTETTPFQLDFISDKFGTERLGQVLLTVEKQGNKQITLSNEKQKLFVTLRLIFNKNSLKHQTQLTIYYGNLDGYDARQGLRIQKILGGPCKLRLTNLETGISSVLHRNEGVMSPPDEKAIGFVDRVCRIQDTMGVILRFPEDGSWTIKDLRAAEELVTIFDKGKTLQTGLRFTLDIFKPTVSEIIAVLKTGEPLSIHETADESYVEILGEKIALGPMTRHVKGHWQASSDEVTQWLSHAESEDVYPVRLENVEVIEEFERWLHK